MGAFAGWAEPLTKQGLPTILDPHKAMLRHSCFRLPISSRPKVKNLTFPLPHSKVPCVALRKTNGRKTEEACQTQNQVKEVWYYGIQ